MYRTLYIKEGYANTCTVDCLGVKSQTEFNHDSTESTEGVKSQREFNHDRTKSAEGVKSRTQFNHDGYKSTKGRLQSVLPTLCHQNGPVKDIIWR